jgi:hypothetical protein
MRAFDLEGQVRRPRAGGQSLLTVTSALTIIVAMEGDIDGADRRRQFQQRVQTFGNPDAAGVDADQGNARGVEMRLHLRGECSAELFGIWRRIRH